LQHGDILDNLDFLGEKGNLYFAQVDALKALHAHFKDESKENIALVVLPTGAGKSGIAVLAPYVLNSTRVLIITPSIIISNQLYKDMCGHPMDSFFVKKGIVNVGDAHLYTENGFLCNSSLGDSIDTIHQFKQHYLVIANAHKFGANSSFDMNELPNTIFDTIIVDEAHHYPAATWKRIVDHFPNSRRVFLTATPYHRGANILGYNMDDQRRRFLAYQLKREDAVNSGLIRNLEYRDVLGNDSHRSLAFSLVEGISPLFEETVRTIAVVQEIMTILKTHDRIHPAFSHQAMIICHLVDEVDRVVDVVNELYKRDEALPVAVAYHGRSRSDGFMSFCADNAIPRLLVVCGKATEGFDRRQVSAVGILRKISPTSSVLFSQFVGRCVRRMGLDDPCTAMVVSHPFYKQRSNFDKLDVLAELDPEDD
jgi:superfamily II DNA or RNA helicase